MGTYITKHGQITIDGDEHMERLLREKGEYMFNDIDACLPYVQGTVIDVGAHVGLWTIPLSKKANTVIAIEPNAFTYAQLTKNITDNKVTNVTARNILLGNATERYTQAPEGPTGTNHYHVGGSIEAYSLDSLGKEKISFVKIDVEGMEPDVLSGGERLIRESQPYFFIEVNPKMLQKYGKTTSDISRHLVGYDFYRFDEEFGWCKIPYLMNSFYNFLAVPKKAPQPKSMHFLSYIVRKLTQRLWHH